MSERKLKLTLDLDLNEANVQRKLNALGQNATKAFSSSGGKVPFAAESEQLSKLEQKLKSLEQLQNKLASQHGYSQEISKVNSEMASVTSAMRKLTTDQEKQVKLLTQEVRLREQSKFLASSTKTASSGSSSSGSAASKISGKSNASVTGTAYSVATNLNSGGGAGSMLSGVLTKLGPFGMALGAVTLGLNAAVGALDKLADKARETSKSVSDNGGGYDRLRQSGKDLASAQSRLETNPVVAVWGVSMDEFNKNLAIGTNELLKFAGKLAGVKDNSSNSLKLHGDDKLSFEKLGRERGNTEKEMAMERLEVERDIFQKRRDYAIELKDFEIQSARSVADLQKQIHREDQDYQIDKTKMLEDFDFKQSEKKFTLDRARASREFQLKLQDEAADFERQKTYEKADLARKQSDEKLDFNTKQTDKAYDFGKSKARSQEDFKDKLVDMGLSGASGIDYFKAARDQRKSMRRASQDYSIEKTRDTRDFGIKQTRETREFGIETQRESDKFKIERTRKSRDFANTEGDAVAERKLEVETHYNTLRWQSIELEKKHSRAIEDNIIALKRQTEDIEIAKTKLGNKGEDIEFQTGMQKEKLEHSEKKTKQSLTDSQRSFAKELKEKFDPTTLQKLASGDPKIRELLIEYGLASGDKFDTGGSSGSFKGNYGSFAVGGFVNVDQLAKIHAGEYVINPADSDKARQADLAMKALNKIGLNPLAADGRKARNMQGGAMQQFGIPTNAAGSHSAIRPVNAIGRVSAFGGVGGVPSTINMGDMNVNSTTLDPALIQQLEQFRQEYERKISEATQKQSQSTLQLIKRSEVSSQQFL